MVVEYLGDGQWKAVKEVDSIRGVHARFEFLRNIYTTEIQRAKRVDGDLDQVVVHRSHALRACLLFLVGTFIFVDKSATYTNVVYLR